MFSIDFTFLWTIIDIIILYLLLRHLLFKRVGTMLQKRADGIAESIAQGEQARGEGETYKKQCAEILASADGERKELIEDARKRSASEYENAVADARREAELILSNARAEIARERAEMLSELESQIASLAILAASRVVEANLDTDANKKLVEKFLKDEGAA